MTSSGAVLDPDTSPPPCAPDPSNETWYTSGDLLDAMEFPIPPVPHRNPIVFLSSDELYAYPTNYDISLKLVRDPLYTRVDEIEIPLFGSDETFKVRVTKYNSRALILFRNFFSLFPKVVSRIICGVTTPTSIPDAEEETKTNSGKFVSGLTLDEIRKVRDWRSRVLSSTQPGQPQVRFLRRTQENAMNGPNLDLDLDVDLDLDLSDSSEVFQDGEVIGIVFVEEGIESESESDSESESESGEKVVDEESCERKIFIQEVKVEGDEGSGETEIETETETEDGNGEGEGEEESGGEREGEGENVPESLIDVEISKDGDDDRSEIGVSSIVGFSSSAEAAGEEEEEEKLEVDYSLTSESDVSSPPALGTRLSTPSPSASLSPVPSLSEDVSTVPVPVPVAQVTASLSETSTHRTISDHVNGSRVRNVFANPESSSAVWTPAAGSSWGPPRRQRQSQDPAGGHSPNSRRNQRHRKSASARAAAERNRAKRRQRAKKKALRREIFDALQEIKARQRPVAATPSQKAVLRLKGGRRVRIDMSMVDDGVKIRGLAKRRKNVPSSLKKQILRERERVSVSRLQPLGPEDLCNRVTPEFNDAVFAFLQKLSRLQAAERKRFDEFVPSRRRKKRKRPRVFEKRFVFGLKETYARIRLHRLRRVEFILCASDLEKVVGKRGILEKVQAIRDFANERSVPFGFALTRRRLGEAIGKPMLEVAMVCVMNIRETNREFDAVRLLLESLMKTEEECQMEKEAALLLQEAIDEGALNSIEGEDEGESEADEVDLDANPALDPAQDPQ